ncbi:MAG: site-specific integrase [Rhizobiales bacterium]|nr:site-specific integrase [Hyphomicrobiales bacterium]
MPRPKREVPWLVWREGMAYASWYDAGARQTRFKTLGTKDAVEARQRFAEFLTTREVIPAFGRLTVSQALKHYTNEHVMPNCADWRRQVDAMKHLEAFFGARAISDVDVPLSRRYIDLRRTQPGKGKVVREPWPNKPEWTRRVKIETTTEDSTIRRELTVLMAAANHARKMKRIRELPVLDRPDDKRIGQDEEAPYYTAGELQALLDQSEGELHYFIDLAYWTGARRASIEELTRPQVKWDQRQIHLQKPGKKATKKRQPIVPILPEMESSLKVLWAASEGRERLFTVSDFFVSFRRLCERLGMADRSHPHCLRHTRASHLLQKGVSIFTVAKLLGDTVATIERVYGHHAQGKMAEELTGK